MLFRYIHFVFEFCDTRTWYVMLFLLLWILGGLAAILYCLISSTGIQGRLEDRAANKPSAKFSQLYREVVKLSAVTKSTFYFL